MTLLWYDVDKPERSYAQVQLFARKNEDGIFLKIVFVSYKREEFTYLLDVRTFVNDRVDIHQPIGNVL